MFLALHTDTAGLKWIRRTNFILQTDNDGKSRCVSSAIGVSSAAVRVEKPQFLLFSFTSASQNRLNVIWQADMWYLICFNLKAASAVSALQNCCIISTVQSSLHLKAVREERSGKEEDDLMLFVQFAAAALTEHHGEIASSCCSSWSAWCNKGDLWMV